MRFIIIYKSPIFHLRRQRLDIENCTQTNQILDVLNNKLGHLDAAFAFRVMRDGAGFRIINGWSIEHYDISEGSEIQIDLLDNTQEEVIRISKNIFNNLGLKHQDSHDAGNEVFVDQQSFNLRQYLDQECQKLLKHVQKNNLKDFLSILEEIPEVQGIRSSYIRKEKQRLIDELGNGGWGCIHFAVYLNRKDFIAELIKKRGDLTKKTNDGWLPLQIAVNRRNKDMIKFLIQQKSLNINAVSSRGTALHVAMMNEYIQGIRLLLTKNVDVKLLDEKGRTCTQLTSNQQCLNLIKQKQQRSNIRQICQQKQVIISLPFTVQIIKGYVYKVKSVLMNLGLRFLVLNPFQATLIRYQNQQSYPKKPIQVIPFANIKTVKMIKQKSWTMKKQYSYFEIYTPQRTIFACKHQKIAQRWVKGIFDTVLFTVEVQKNKLLKERIPRRLALLDDNKNQIIDITNNDSVIISPTKSFIKKSNIFISDNEQKLVKSTITSFSKAVETKKQQLPKSSITQSPEKVKPQQQKQVLMNAPQFTETFIEINDEQQKKQKFKNFQIIELLGQGAFAKVFLAKNIKTGEIFALKALKKKTLIVKKQLKYALSEANVLKKVNHQFIINLHCAFQTPNYLYLALDYCSGKDLNYHIQKEVTFSEEDTRFYLAQLVLALEHLHSKNIIYRDMKPENVLLDKQGHVKLADFGLSKDNFNEKSKSFCGSPAYLSPQMLQQREVGKQADIYGIGCIMYECLVGLPPFYSDNIPKLYQDIKQGILKYPPNLSAQARNILKGLLQRDPKKRLGAKGDYSAIKKHPFFQEIDWQALIQNKISPPVRNLSKNNDSDSDNSQQDIINQKKVQFTDYDYDENTKKINRLINFSFVRQQPQQ